MLGTKLVDGFLDVANSWLCDGYALDLRYIALRSGTKLNLLEASIGFWPLPPSIDQSLTISTQGIVAGRHQTFPMDKSRIMEFLQTATSGKIELGNIQMELEPSESIDYYSDMTNQNHWEFPLHLEIVASEARHPDYQKIARIDAELRRTDPPFDGTSDLCTLLGLNHDFSGSKMPSITLRVAPPVDLIFEKTTLNDNRLSATLHAHPKLNLNRIGLAVRAAPGEGLSSRRQAGQLIEWCDAIDDRRVGRLDITLPNCDSMLTMLALEDVTVRRQWIVDPPKARNHRFIALNQFDPDLRKFRKSLFDSADSREFEKAVSALLFMLGFSSAMPIGSDSPDIVVTTPLGQTIIVECTTRLADYATKFGKLVERRAALSKALATANLESSVISALVCRLPADEIVAKKDDLAAHKILLFSVEDIDSALHRIRFLVDPDKFLGEDCRMSR